MENSENIAYTEDERVFQSAVSLRTIPYRLMQYIQSQSDKRQLTESEIISECIEYHKENAGT